MGNATYFMWSFWEQTVFSYLGMGHLVSVQDGVAMYLLTDKEHLNTSNGESTLSESMPVTETGCPLA